MRSSSRLGISERSCGRGHRCPGRSPALQSLPALPPGRPPPPGAPHQCIAGTMCCWQRGQSGADWPPPVSNPRQPWPDARHSRARIFPRRRSRPAAEISPGQWHSPQSPSTFVLVHSVPAPMQCSRTAAGSSKRSARRNGCSFPCPNPPCLSQCGREARVLSPQSR